MSARHSCLEIFVRCVEATRENKLIRRESKQDKEFHFQNWFKARLDETTLNFEVGGRNTYPDFRLVASTDGFEVKGLAYQRCSEELNQSRLPLPTLELKDGFNTRQVLNDGYRSWREFFNDRQLLALGWLHAAILDLPDDAVRPALRTVFSGVLEFNNMFASYKGEGTGAIRHMFAHHILKPERVPIEGNVWGTSKSSGSFSTLFKSRLLRAIEYHSAPFELEIERANGGSNGKRVFGGSSPFTGCVQTEWPPVRKTEHRAIHLSCGSSSSTGLADTSVDLVVTDPPFFDNVHYSELADFFFAWQQLGSSPFVGKRTTTRQVEEVQDTSAEQFAAKLRAVFTECCRILQEDGLLVFTYHHSRMDGWTSLADAVVGAGFSLINCHPVKSEMSVAAPKSQAKEPIQLDVVLVCKKQTADCRKITDAKMAFRRAVEHATSKANRLKDCGLCLSVNDRRVILISQFLVETSAGRSVEQIRDELSNALTDLDLAAMILLDRQTAQPEKPIPLDEDQLVLFDKAHPDCAGNVRTPRSRVRSKGRFQEGPGGDSSCGPGSASIENVEEAPS